MTFYQKRLLPLTVMILIFSGPFVWESNAATVTISTGFIDANTVNDFTPQYSLTGVDEHGNAFSNAGGLFANAGSFGAGLPIPGQPFSPNASGTFQSPGPNGCGFVPTMCGGVVQLGNQVFDTNSVRYSGVFSILSTVLIPPGPVPPGPTGQFSAPFTFTGTLVGHNNSTGAQVFDLALMGQGTTTLDFRNSALLGVTYRFAPVPEPASWLLMASGLIALAGMRRWRATC